MNDEMQRENKFIGIYRFAPIFFLKNCNKKLIDNLCHFYLYTRNYTRKKRNIIKRVKTESTQFYKIMYFSLDGQKSM